MWNPTTKQWIAFGQAVYAWHRISEPRADWPDLAWCTCGIPAVLCAYVGAAHRYLGLPVPWDRPPGRRDDRRPPPHPRPG